ncbi:MAG: beta-propeller domain-containing protein [Lachnospiraceae bacterium]
MEKREQDILKQIKDSTEDIKVPESLKPEEIEKMLEAKAKKENVKRKARYRFASLAAACVVFAVGALLYNMSDLGKNSMTDSSETVSNETLEGSNKDVSDDEGKTDEVKDDYSEVYAYIEKQQKERGYDSGSLYHVIESSSLSSGAKMESSVENTDLSDEAGAVSGDYSETNLREAGIDEADIVKTDGRYLYVMKENGKEISVVDTEKELKKRGSISIAEDENAEEFYLITDEKKMIVIVSERTESGEEMYSSETEKIQAITYDISSPEKPKKLGSISQSGMYTSSRFSDGYLYLFSEYYIQNDVKKDRPETYVPMAGDSLIKEKDILLPLSSRGCMYEVVTAVSLDSPSEISDSKAIFTNGGELYVSINNIYYYETEWSDDGESVQTKIRKLGYGEGTFTKAKTGSVKGYLNDSFSIDEYNGYLRIVATDDEANAVYVLDKDMEIVGSIKNVAKGEEIYSARFIRDTGYFVTFRQVDPLFSVDLSEPENPEIIGKLKIPGFSEYLHFYGDGKLLGIGMDVDEESQVTEGVKISMFDISDKTDVKEENKYILKNAYSTDVFYDYKAVLIDVEKNLIGFSANTEGGEKYYIFAYDEKEGFQCKMAEEVNGSSMWGTRGVYIGEMLYVIRGNVIEAYSLKDYGKKDDLIL